MTALATAAMDGPESGERVCPRCRRPASALPESATSTSGAGIAKCPAHHLALVERRELARCEGDTLLGTTIAGRFTILGRLGKGSMGAVYRARQAAVGRDVALKIVRRDRAYDSETKARFEREARAISSLSSPHTITAFDFGESEDGSWFLAMEMLDGESVGDRLRREGRIEWPDAVRFACEALKSLAEAHAKGIVHRDLKPDNLFLVRLPESDARRELCKVLDFGIAKWQSGSEAPIDQLETQAGTVFGTPRYMSPEQAQGNALDARSDLYSLGVLLFQMLSGKAPFTDDDAVVVMARHIKDEPPLFIEVTPELSIPLPLERVVRRALRKAPADRPQSAAEMSAELEEVAQLVRAQSSGQLPVLAPPAMLTRPFHSNWVLVGAALVAMVLAGLVVAAGRVWSSRARVAAPGAAADTLSTTAVPQAQPTPLVPGDAPIPEESSEAALSSKNAAVTNTENSAAASASAPSAVTRAPRVRSSASSAPSARGLARKGNERYGRFE